MKIIILLSCSLCLPTWAFQLERSVDGDCGVDGANLENCTNDQVCAEPPLCGAPCTWRCTIGGTVNIALDQPATQSSNHGNDFASKAVDGCIDPDLTNSRCISHTLKEFEPWWQVDLGQEFLIDRVVLRRRTDCCPGRWHNIKMFMNTDTSSDLAFHDASAEPAPLFVVPGRGRIARYIHLMIAGRSGFLEITEVEVYAVPNCWACDVLSEQENGHMHCEQSGTVAGCVCDDHWFHPSTDPFDPCEDINECDEENICGPNFQCVNLPGTFECRCSPGFQSVDGTCEAIKECEDHLHHCDVHATCLDDCNGSCICTCNDGYVGSGYPGECRRSHHRGCSSRYDNGRHGHHRQ